MPNAVGDSEAKIIKFLFFLRANGAGTKAVVRAPRSLAEASMPQIHVNEDQVLRALDELSPAAKRAALTRLTRGLDALDRLVARNRDRIDDEMICRERGLDFARLTEEDRERLIADLLHQAPWMRVVLDANILVSALLWRGAPYRCPSSKR